MQKFSHIDDIHRRIFAAMLANLDDSVGEVLKKLDTEGLRENTLVMFMSDNGGPTRELTSSNAPLRGEKGQVYEGGLRVPFLMRWPGITKRGTTFKYPVTALDIVPTVAAATGARLPKEIYDGVDLTPHLAGDSTKPPHEQLFWRIGNRHALRYGHWKILSQRGRDWELYNLEADIGETKNLSAENSAKLAELIGAWETENTEMIAPIWKL